MSLDTSVDNQGILTYDAKNLPPIKTRFVVIERSQDEIYSSFHRQANKFVGKGSEVSAYHHGVGVYAIFQGESDIQIIPFEQCKWI